MKPTVHFGIFLTAALLAIPAYGQHMNEKDSPCANVVVTAELTKCLSDARDRETPSSTPFTSKSWWSTAYMLSSSSHSYPHELHVQILAWTAMGSLSDDAALVNGLLSSRQVTSAE
jgi:hypothetical protein